MRTFVLNFQSLAIQIENFTNFFLQNNLQMFVIIINFVKVRTLNAYTKIL